MFANEIGLGLPILEARLRENWFLISFVRSRPSASSSVCWHPSSSSVWMFTCSSLPLRQFGGQASALTNASPAAPGPWKGFLASFYGGFDEELLLRLCVMSFLAWLGRFVSRTAEGRPTLVVLWVANVPAAILFGLGHLPATALLLPLTPLVVLRAVILNGLAGVAFGYLYFTRGLESAMLSHFTGDLVPHVLFAMRRIK